VSYQLKEEDGELKLTEVSRREAYLCDILYGTNNEYGFDYLRDNMAHGIDRTSQRGLNYAIVDEVDSILIDEARTPLIISAPAEESTEKYFKFSELVRRLKENEDYNIDEKMRAATLTEDGIARLEKMLNVENIYAAGGMRDVHHIEQALKAMALFKRDRDYVIKDGEIVIVDEFTGRLMFGRRYSEGLHQAIEAKENVKVQRESQTLASVTFQNYFRMYRKLAGMTGTAVTEAEEFAKIYNLETVVVPTNKPMVRKDMNDLVYRSEMGKFKAVVEETKRRHQAGQPILIGTISIEKNELLADMMEREGLKPQVLNAKQHEKEAQIIAQAGKLGAITIATNMAGRGVDIILGGNPSAAEEQQAVKELGGLHIIGTERHESRRIDNQLRGRAGRQGDPGSSQFYVSMEDDLMRIFGGERMKNLMQTLKVPEDMPIENKMVSHSIESAQAKVESNNFDIRKHLVEYDDVINKHREAIYKRRREILTMPASPTEAKDRLEEMILHMAENEIEQVVLFHTAAEKVEDWNLDEIYQVASTIFPVEEKLKTDLSNYTKNGNKLDKVQARTAIIEHLAALAAKNYKKIKQTAEAAGIIWQDIERAILLRSIDTLWMEHLDSMDHMRKGIGLRGYGQRDPLVEYKKEAYRLFNELNDLIQKEVVYSIFKVGDVRQMATPIAERRATQFSAPAKEMTDKNSSFSQFKAADSANASSSFQPVKNKAKDEAGHKIGRNDPCPCGSGKKYKKCCGK
jgi:preprotein translocase subunit SecA